MQLQCPVCNKFFNRKPSYLKEVPPPYRCSKKCQYNIETRFWDHVNKTASCWLWTGTVNHNGYGKLMVADRYVLAHRIAWQLIRGPIPKGLNVCHDCPGGDNTLCVNPAHLFIGTQADNARDARKKNRTPMGESHPMAKLTAKAVVDIRRAYAANEEDQYELADRFGVAVMTINRIVNWKAWTHLSYPTT